ncbi:Cholinesterase, partial [Colletotrichum tanaceti]
VSEYLGIPYAQPPVVNLRFQPPVKFTGSSTINGSAFGHQCMQPTVNANASVPDGFANLGVPTSAVSVLGVLADPGSQSEDCLTLNVWTKPQVGEEKKAVMVWIHGGAFMLGSSRVPATNGQFITDQSDVVLVSLNYRLNVFGFPGNPASAPNLGLLDVRMAVQWVRENIDKFGGDVNRITLFGQSAGGSLVDYYSYAFASDPIANGFIAMSGTANGFGVFTNKSVNARWFGITAAVGCGDAQTDPVTVHNCMLLKSPAEIVNGITASGTGAPGAAVFAPVVDDTLVFADYGGRASANGGYIVGNDDNEAGLFKLGAPTINETVWTGLNLVSFECPAARRATRAAAAGHPTWRYRYFGDFPNMVLSTTPSSGAWHTSELPILFDTTPQSPIVNTPQETDTGFYFRAAWTAFAKNPSTGLLRFDGNETWAPYQVDGSNLNRLAFEGQTRTNLGTAVPFDENLIAKTHHRCHRHLFVAIAVSSLSSSPPLRKSSVFVEHLNNMPQQQTDNTQLEAFTSSQDESEDGHTAQSLPRADEGMPAWKFLLGAFVVEAVLWGFPVSYGVFQDFYSKHPDFRDDPNIAVIGTVATSIYYLGGPVALPLVARFQAWQRPLIVVGWLGCVASLVAASFATTVPGLIATQGVLYGLAFMLLNYPVLRMLNEWFVRRRGFAFGIMSAGAGCSGVGLPFLIDLLLSRYGYRTTLRAVGVAQFVVVLPVVPLLRGRLPVSKQAALRRVDFAFFRNPLFYCFALANLLQALGYYIPSLYLPTYATALGLSGTMGALLLAANNLAVIVGQLALGYVSDRVNNVLILVFASSFAASVASFAVWGNAASLAPLMAFSLAFGLATGGFPCLWPKFGSILADDPGPVYGFMAFGKGVGNILTGPISAPLMAGAVGSGYGLGRFEPLILYLGSMMLCSSLGIMGWPLFRHDNKR